MLFWYLDTHKAGSRKVFTDKEVFILSGQGLHFQNKVTSTCWRLFVQILVTFFGVNIYHKPSKAVEDIPGFLYGQLPTSHDYEITMISLSGFK